MNIPLYLSDEYLYLDHLWRWIYLYVYLMNIYAWLYEHEYTSVSIWWISMLRPSMNMNIPVCLSDEYLCLALWRWIYLYVYLMNIYAWLYEDEYTSMSIWWISMPRPDVSRTSVCDTNPFPRYISTLSLLTRIL